MAAASLALIAAIALAVFDHIFDFSVEAQLFGLTWVVFYHILSKELHTEGRS